MNKKEIAFVKSLNYDKIEKIILFGSVHVEMIIQI
jgi:hypothetical protein